VVAPTSPTGEVIRHAPVRLPDAAAQLQPGEALVFHYPDAHTPCLLIRTADAFVGFTQKCTHLACPVVPNAEAQTLDCPCHKGAFSMHDGAPLSGPPRSGLSQVMLEKREGHWVATGIRTPGEVATTEAATIETAATETAATETAATETAANEASATKAAAADSHVTG